MTVPSTLASFLFHITYQNHKEILLAGPPKYIQDVTILPTLTAIPMVQSPSPVNAGDCNSLLTILLGYPAPHSLLSTITQKAFYFQKCIYLKGRMTEQKGRNKGIFRLLVFSSNGCNRQEWAQLKAVTGTPSGSSMSVQRSTCLRHHLLPCQVH